MANINNDKVLNRPPLRFPEFSGEWEKSKLNDCCSFFSGGTPSSSRKEYYNGTIPFIRFGEIHSSTTELSISQDGLNDSSAKMVEIGDLLLALYGATSGEIGICKIKGAINQAILCIRTKHNSYFLKSVWEKHCAKILRTYLQGGQGNLSAEIVRSISFAFPSKEEQTKIACLISLLDKRISTQIGLIEDLKKLKSAIYNCTFKGLRSCKVLLESICSIVKGQQVNGEDLDECGLYYVMNGGIEPSGYYDRYNVEANTISISEGGNSCGYVQYNEKPFWSGGHCYTLQNLSTNVVNQYLYHYLKSRQSEIMKLRIGSGLPNIQKKDLAKLEILLPTIDEQTKIAERLSAIEKKITVETAVKDCYVRQRQYLLREMFV